MIEVTVKFRSIIKGLDTTVIGKGYIITGDDKTKNQYCH